MARTRVQMLSPGSRSVLLDPGVEAELRRRAQAAASSFSGQAVRLTGAYASSAEVVMERHGDRLVAKVRAGVPYSMKLEAKYGAMARALDAAGGA